MWNNKRFVGIKHSLIKWIEEKRYLLGNKFFLQVLCFRNNRRTVLLLDGRKDANLHLDCNLWSIFRLMGLNDAGALLSFNAFESTSLVEDFEPFWFTVKTEAKNKHD